MQRKTLSLVFVLSLLAPAAAVAGGSSNVTVVFDHPEKFTDVKDSYVGSELGRDAILAEIRQFVESRAKSYLREDQRLEVTFTNIDLAGDFEPSNGPAFDRVRLMKGVYPPRLKLEFKLTGVDGKVINEGKRTLTDLAYQTRILLPVDADDNLRYERSLLIDWMREDLRSAKTAGS